jgi:hypothetical protein
MFIGFAAMIFGVGYYRFTKLSYYEFIGISERIDAQIVTLQRIDEKPISFYLSIPFAFIEYGSVDLIYAKPIIRYEKLNGIETAFENDFPITIPRNQKDCEILYNPKNDRAISNDTFYLRGWLWISSIISLVLLTLGLYSLKM